MRRYVRRRAPFLLAALVWAGSLVGCGGAEGELCAIADECVNGNDADLDACENDLSTAADVAAVYDCSAEWDELIACAIDNNDCNDGEFEIDDSCEDESEDYDDCID